MKKPGSKKRKLLIALVLIVFLPFLILLIAIQPFFIRFVVLPQVAKATDSSITVASLSFSPRSEIYLEGLHYLANDQSVNAEVKSVSVRYDLRKILKGSIHIDEITLVQPDVSYRSPLTTADKTKTVDETASKKPPTLHIQNVVIKDGTFRLIQAEQTLELSKLNFELPSLVTGEPIHPVFETKFLAFETDNPDASPLEGSIEADFIIGLNQNLLPTAAKGSLLAKAHQTGAEVPESMDVNLSTDLELDIETKVFSIRELSALARQADQDILRLELDQPTEIRFSDASPTFSDTRLRLYIPRVDIPGLPFAQFLPITSGNLFIDSDVEVTGSGSDIRGRLDFGIENLSVSTPDPDDFILAKRLSGNAALHWEEGSRGDLQLNLDAVDVRTPNGKKLPSPLVLKLDADATPSKVEVKELLVSWSATPESDNQVQINGFADWRNPEAIQSDLTLRANQLDLQPWSAFLVQQDSVSTQTPDPNKPDKGTEKINLSPLPIHEINADLEIGGIVLGKIDLQTIRFVLKAGSESLRVQPLGFKVNGSTFLSDLDMSWQEDPIQFSTNSSLSPLDLQPIADTLLPNKKGAIKGILQGSTVFSTQGSTIDELWQGLDGSIDFSYTDGKLRLIDPDADRNSGLFHTRKLVQDLLTALANSLKLSPAQLMTPQIEAVLLNASIQKQRLTLNQAKIENPEVLMNAQGEVLLSKNIGTSQIKNLPVIMGVNTNLAKRVKIYRDSRVQENYVILPSFIGVSGSLETPRIDVKESVIAGLILTGVTERNDFGNENVQTGLDILGTLLTGEPPPAKPKPTPKPAPPGSTPTPTPKPDKATQILEGIRFIQGLRATPTPKAPGP